MSMQPKRFSFKDFINKVKQDGEFQRIHQQYLEKKAIKYQRRNIPETLDMLKKFFKENLNEEDKKKDKGSN